MPKSFSLVKSNHLYRHPALLTCSIVTERNCKKTKWLQVWSACTKWLRAFWFLEHADKAIQLQEYITSMANDMAIR